MSKRKVIAISILALIPLMLTFGSIINWFAEDGTGAHAKVYDELFNLYWTLGTIVAIIVYGYFVWLLSTADYTGDEDAPDCPVIGVEPIERGTAKVAWTISAAITIFLLVLSQVTFDSIDFFEDINANTTEESFTVQIVGYQYYWTYEYPDGTILSSATEEPLRIPVDVPIVFEVSSGDVFHNFALPEHRVKADAIPGRSISIWIEAEEVGTYPIRCFELCGASHTNMIGELEVMEKNDFETWYRGGV
ncbi:MAG: cytochrome c oxidase subunit II [Candidatus Poseidoniaceae archaeon]|nr:cytochrome c oxidase subunit II [Candidatus Poseidoniaceae archaeon]MDP7001256.1 cytochrome c oxidase subunit II [Candidatus Poseidoniaceae archaeon]